MFIFKYALKSLDLYLEEGGSHIKIIIQTPVRIAKKTRKLSKVYICLCFKINNLKLLFQHHKY